jgi:hypothetical protein
MMLECAIGLSRIPDLFYCSERNRYVGIIAMIELQRNLHDVILSESELTRINTSLQFSEPITRIDLNRARRKILWKSPGLRQQWKEIRARTHGQALHNAVHESFKQDLALDLLSRRQIKRIWRTLVHVTKQFLKTEEGRRVNAYQSWGRAIVYHTLKEFPNLDIKAIFSVPKLNVICTTRTRLNKALNSINPRSFTPTPTRPESVQSPATSKNKPMSTPQVSFESTNESMDVESDSESIVLYPGRRAWTHLAPEAGMATG